MRPEWNGGCCPHYAFRIYEDGAKECVDCGEIEELDASPLDEPPEIEDALMELWAERSELFEPPRLDYHGD